MPIPPAAAPPAHSFSSPTPREDADFDAWLRRELIAEHDHIMLEPVPQRLLEVLEGMRTG